MLKICRQCKVEKPIECFEKNQIAKNNRVVRRPVCKECRRSKVKINLQEKKKFEKNKIQIGENFECPICLDTFIRTYNNDVVLDHDHTNGSVRGYICGNCNTGLGRFKDDIQTMNRAINWLKKSEKRT